MAFIDDAVVYATAGLEQDHHTGHVIVAARPIGTLVMTSLHDRPSSARSSRRLAIASLVLSCAGPVWFVSPLVGLPWLWAWGAGLIAAGGGAVLGHVARRRRPAPSEGGYDLALAGVVIGWSVACIGLLGLAVFGLSAYLDAGTS